MIKLESYNLDTLRKLIRTLQAENKTLRELLAEKQIPVEASRVFQQGLNEPDDYDPDQGSCRFLLTMIWQDDSMGCSGDVPTYLPSEAKRVDTSPSVKTDGTTRFVQSSGERKHPVIPVPTGNGSH